MYRLFTGALCAPLLLCGHLNSACAQAPPPDPLQITVTANRIPTSIERSGSSVTVISAEDIRKSNPATVVDVLRQVPGLAISSNGGPSQPTTVLLRGGASRHTLVLVDGVRVNDPSSVEGEFDFSTLVPADIERIEVLRGPQSALYGSDAMGGVINIITRKGRGDPRVSLSVEGGSYATRALTASVSGGASTYSYALSLTGAQTAGYSTIGARIGRFEARSPLGLENDGFTRLGGSARFSFRPAPGTEIEFGFTRSRNRTQFDQTFGVFDVPARSASDATTGFLRATVDSFDGLLKTRVTLYGNRTDRYIRSDAYFPPFFGVGGFGRSDFAFVGTRTGGEAQSTLDLRQLGSLTWGGALENERYTGRSTPVLDPFGGDVPTQNRAQRETRSAFLMHQITLGERLDVSLGGRMDDVQKVSTFFTGRATAAYRITETSTKLRTSFGTGAKAPALDQLYNPSYGTPSLRPERSIGGDVGIEQQLLDGRAQVSVTGFANRYRDLFVFAPFDTNTFTYSTCPPAQANSGCYYNQASARTRGLEVEGRLQLLPGFVTLSGSYTYLDARDTQTGFKLARRPMNQGRMQLTLTPVEGLTIEPSVMLVGQRFSSPGQRQMLQPYARFDMRVAYKLNANFEIYVRGENLTDAKYQDVAGYGTPGRSAYAGIRTTW